MTAKVRAIRKPQNEITVMEMNAALGRYTGNGLLAFLSCGILPPVTHHHRGNDTRQAESDKKNLVFNKSELILTKMYIHASAKKIFPKFVWDCFVYTHSLIQLCINNYILHPANIQHPYLRFMYIPFQSIDAKLPVIKAGLERLVSATWTRTPPVQVLELTHKQVNYLMHL